MTDDQPIAADTQTPAALPAESATSAETSGTAETSAIPADVAVAPDAVEPVEAATAEDEHPAAVQKSAPVKQSAPAEEATPAKKATPAKPAPAEKAEPVRKAAAVKQAAPAQQAPAAQQAGDAGQSGGRDIWRRIGAVAIVLVASFAVVVLWARPAHEPAPPVAQRSSAPPAVTVLNPTDIAYLQLMISLDVSAAQLFDLIVASGDPVLGPIARSAADGHRTELVALRKALTDGGAVEDSSIHAGHDLPGMVIDADMAAIRALPAAQQPAKAAEVLREHLTGTTALCGSEAKNGADPATKATAAAVLDAHGKLLAQLPAM